MKKILHLQELNSILKDLHDNQKDIVLAGGCFDILHKGHIEFLKQAKTYGDILVLLLENDASITKRKGASRPINTQSVRSSVLAALHEVDYVIELPEIMTDADYDTVVLTIKPAIIATTKGDPGIIHKERQARKVGGQVREVIERLPEHASSRLAESIQS